MSAEETLWKGTSSQWLNIGPFTAAVLAAVGIVVGAVFFPPAFLALVLPLAYAVWKFLVVRTRVFEITGERIRITQGVINQHVDEIELYRVKDTQLFRTWWMRLTGLGSIFLDTSDRSTPKLTIPAISNSMEVRETLRKQVELQRDKKRVREMDFDDADADGLGDL
ncbi:MAG: PH domain-containing protein [Akkermansiaceae bacterium]|nr:PH domain-containing protein [Akkermansiaceae bacterium]MCP5546382.1 PH domain-containing protein [Akkermansiaceae bacterium]